MADEPAWVHNDQGERSAAIVNIDNGKYVVVVALCAAVSGMAAVFAWHSTIVASSVDTNYAVLLNHQTKIESRLEYVESEIKELKHAKQ